MADAQVIDQIDWTADSWFRSWAPHASVAFKVWWVQEFGPPPTEDEAISSDDIIDYWHQCGFALQGWLARGEVSHG